MATVPLHPIWRLFLFIQYGNCSYSSNMATVPLHPIWRLFLFIQYGDCSSSSNMATVPLPPVWRLFLFIQYAVCPFQSNMPSVPFDSIWCLSLLIQYGICPSSSNMESKMWLNLNLWRPRGPSWVNILPSFYNVLSECPWCMYVPMGKVNKHWVVCSWKKLLSIHTVLYS